MQVQAWRHGRQGRMSEESRRIFSESGSALATITYFIGRVCFGLVFVMFGATHFSASTVLYAASQGVPYPQIAVPVSGIIAIVGALCVMSGVGVRFGATLVILFLVPVTLIMHAFWRIEDPNMEMIQRVMFFKNLSMLGAAIIIALNGAGNRYR
ncbi:MAG: DoxX family protein [Ignavibacteria bacterium]|nr:DoxX family protein [Ignavibacteria bacterium]